MKNYLILFFAFVMAGSAMQAQPIEKLEYHLKYSFIKGGEAFILISDTSYQGMPARHYYLRGQTVGLADALYNVDDVYETILNPQTVRPYLHIRNIKERKYRFYNETRFFDNDSIFSQRSGGKTVPPNMLDILSVFGYLRQNQLLESLKVGDTFTLPVYHADKYFMMETKFLGIEKVKTKIGNKECYVISPWIDEGKLLKRSDGLKFYITKDEDKIPVILELDLNLGAVRAELVSYFKVSQ
ncbi:DUF3108 domain-containing protein [Mangrovibacterium marinum]|uniref:Uncharacterized protein DUF3108 n=1 Tax=Mangrovibacterium marinum TaxID=1639118 RepID=A0A2T5BX03_9BACT|nr:DUF3108 domain-containing protein [Mangrovibacterium marinum]PTN04243.1 uncharacterized protein DUF3108 [Mangrovibacterium marinum]